MYCEITSWMKVLAPLVQRGGVVYHTAEDDEKCSRRAVAFVHFAVYILKPDSPLFHSLDYWVNKCCLYKCLPPIKATKNIVVILWDPVLHVYGL